MITIFLFFWVIGITGFCVKSMPPESSQSFYPTARYYTRWWWFVGIIKKADMRWQLDWLKKNGFGGVEIVFILRYLETPDVSKIKKAASIKMKYFNYDWNLNEQKI